MQSLPASQEEGRKNKQTHPPLLLPPHLQEVGGENLNDTEDGLGKGGANENS